MSGATLKLLVTLLAGVGGMALIEHTALYPPPKRGLQLVIALTLSVMLLRHVGVV